MDHFEQINETSYLSVQNAPVYRKIMRCFYREYEKMHFQLYKEDIFQFLKEDDAFELYSMEQLVQDLEALVKWKNLTPIQDPGKVYTIADYKNKQYRYTMSEYAVEIERLIRGLNSWPSAYTKYEGKTLKIWKSRVAENSEKEQQQKPGTIVRVTDDSIYVQTGEGVLELLEVQLEGKKRMQVKDFLLGHRPQAGTVLG